MQNKQTFARRFFELFTLPASLRLNTQRRSAPSMRAFKEEKRSVLISVTLMKGITGYKITVPTIGITLCMYVKDPTMWQRLEGKVSFLCLFVYLFIYFFVIHISCFFFSSYFFCYPHFFPSACAIRRYPVRVLQIPSLDAVILKADLFLVSLWIDVCHFLEPTATNWTGCVEQGVKVLRISHFPLS